MNTGHILSFLSCCLFGASFAESFGQESNLPPPQIGSELSWNKSTLAYFNRNLDIEKKTTDPKIIIFDFISKKSTILPEDTNLLAVLVFDEVIVSTLINGKLKGYLKDGRVIDKIHQIDPVSACLSVCKISENGVFAVLSLSKGDSRENGKYEVLIMNIVDSEFKIAKKIPVVKSGRLVYRSEGLWLIGKDVAIKLDWR